MRSSGLVISTAKSGPPHQWAAIPGRVLVQVDRDIGAAVIFDPIVGAVTDVDAWKHQTEPGHLDHTRQCIGEAVHNGLVLDVRQRHDDVDPVPDLVVAIQAVLLALADQIAHRVVVENQGARGSFLRAGPCPIRSAGAEPTSPILHRMAHCSCTSVPGGGGMMLGSSSRRPPPGPLSIWCCGLGRLREAVDLDEALGGGGVVLVALLVGGQLVAVEAVLALAADDHARGPCTA